MTTDTIAAIATPPGRGGVGIIRISGPLVLQISSAFLNTTPLPRHAHYSAFLGSDGKALDYGIALFFPAPNSFTGEDVLELHGHGGPVVMDLMLKHVVTLGARLARPGEFSERAFLNDKIDLTEAEAIADLIDSASEDAARLALRSLEGEFSKCVNQVLEKLIHLRTYIEAAIDFPEEEIDFLSDNRIQMDLKKLIEQLEITLTAARQGCLVREGMTIVIAGCPNAGKSTLLNSLTGRESAIVTDIPGTTRDILREKINIDGLPVQIIDTAGLRTSEDIVEKEGIRRAWGEIEKADRILLLVDSSLGLGEKEQAIIARLPKHIGLTIIKNKIDLTNQPVGMDDGQYGKEISLSAKNHKGMELLKQHLKDCVGYQVAGEGSFMARRRHIDALERAKQHICAGQDQLLNYGAGELLAADLNQAQIELAKITGEFTSDDLLTEIFSNFCIGK